MRRPATFGNSRPGRLRLAAFIALLVFVIGFPAVMLAFGDWDDWGDRMRGHMYGGRDTSREPLTDGGARNEIDIRDFAFRPGALRVPVGATVTWINADDVPHTATDRGDDWDSGRLDEGESATLTFDRAGDFRYYCIYHPNMEARLVVE